MHAVFCVGRPFGISLGLFILLNLILAVKEPRLSANDVCLSIPFEEPWLSIFASVPGFALVAPHSWSRHTWFRVLQSGVFVGFATLAVIDAVRYYHMIAVGRIESHALFPFSLLIVCILVAESIRVQRWIPANGAVPRPARRFFGAIGVAIACLFLTVAHIYTYGMTDYTVHAGHVNAAVILGAKVHPGGRLSQALQDRITRGVQLYHDGVVDYLVLTGGIDANGESEPDAMASAAVGMGVAPAHIIIDREGSTTYESARNCVRIANTFGFGPLIVVSQYFHNARVKMIFERSGLECYTVPANPSRRFRREPYFLLREAVAYPYYLLFRQ